MRINLLSIWFLKFEWQMHYSVFSKFSCHKYSHYSDLAIISRYWCLILSSPWVSNAKLVERQLSFGNSVAFLFISYLWIHLFQSLVLSVNSASFPWLLCHQIVVILEHDLFSNWGDGWVGETPFGKFQLDLFLFFDPFPKWANLLSVIYLHLSNCFYWYLKDSRNALLLFYACCFLMHVAFIHI